MITLLSPTRTMNMSPVSGTYPPATTPQFLSEAERIISGVKKLSAKELEDLPVSTLAEALQGQINGLSIDLGSSRPGGALNNEVYIRQARTMNGLSKDGVR